jgi:asparagine synthase (glutamine-hydrolysing)
VCGIVGAVCASPDRRPDLDVLRRMAARLRHRGPDDEGFAVRGPAGLGMRRLRIIDLEGGGQPMTGEDESVWLVLNGEIYNYQALTERLRAAGHRFRSRSDTEAVVHAWEEWERASLDRLAGMFALALWDGPTATLTLARDRLGIKPLYYAVLPDQIVFASELRAMLEHPGVGRQLDPAALSLYLAHEHVPAPHAILRDVRKLPAGHWLSYTAGRVKVEPYWDVPYGRSAPIGEAAAIEQLTAALEAAVREHLASDVPLGFFLSGGIDSAAVAALAAPHVRRLRTFTIGFDDASFDESAPARATALALGADHHEDRLGAGATLDLVGRLPDLVDEPLGDASILPTFLLSRFARQSVTVALSGDGGDELFAGYPTCPAHRAADLYRRLPGWLRDGLVRPLVERLPVSHADLSLDFRLKRFVAGAGLDLVDRHAAWMGSFTPGEQRGLLTPAALAAMPAPPSYACYHRIAGQVGDPAWLHRILYLDLKTYLGEGVLAKVDRASMACSLEVRVPLLDHRVVELVAGLPPSLKLRGLTTKYLLKRAMRGRLPEPLLARRKKGFGVPLGRWFRAELEPLLRDTLSPAALGRGGLFRAAAVERLLTEHRQARADHRKKLYTLLAFQLWADRHRIADA